MLSTRTKPVEYQHTTHTIRYRSNTLLKTDTLIESLNAVVLYEWYAINLYVVDLCLKLHTLVFLAPDNGTEVGMVDADNAMPDFLARKQDGLCQEEGQDGCVWHLQSFHPWWDRKGLSERHRQGCVWLEEHQGNFSLTRKKRLFAPLALMATTRTCYCQLLKWELGMDTSKFVFCKAVTIAL